MHQKQTKINQCSIVMHITSTILVAQCYKWTSITKLRGCIEPSYSKKLSGLPNITQDQLLDLLWETWHEAKPDFIGLVKIDPDLNQRSNVLGFFVTKGEGEQHPVMIDANELGLPIPPNFAQWFRRSSNTFGYRSLPDGFSNSSQSNPFEKSIREVAFAPLICSNSKSNENFVLSAANFDQTVIKNPLNPTRRFLRSKVTGLWMSAQHSFCQYLEDRNNEDTSKLITAYNINRTEWNSIKPGEFNKAIEVIFTSLSAFGISGLRFYLVSEKRVQGILEKGCLQNPYHTEFPDLVNCALDSDFATDELCSIDLLELSKTPETTYAFYPYLDKNSGLLLYLEWEDCNNLSQFESILLSSLVERYLWLFERNLNSIGLLNDLKNLFE